MRNLNDEVSMLSAADSPARTSPSPARGQAWQAPARDYGKSTPELLANFDPDTSSWRTSQHCLVEGLETFSETWPRSGMMRNGTAYQLPPLVPRTYEIECGSSLGRPQLHKGPEESGYWPTPRAIDNGQIKTSRTDSRNLKSSPTLSEMVLRWPTPTARDYRSPGRSRLERTGSTAGECLPQAIGGQLNPTWVEWLMGFPLGWTALKHWVTPLSRRSRK
jgi:hypothetical protein